MNTDEEFIPHRIALFEKIYTRQQDEIKSLTGSITVTLSETQVQVDKGTKSPFEIAKSISPKLTKTAVIAKVNGHLFDLHRPLVENSTIELLDFDTEEGRKVFWHSSAHVLGECLESLYDGKLTIGPPLEDCFYYDADLADGKRLSQADYSAIESEFEKNCRSSQKFQRVVLTKSEAVEMFKYNPYKLQLIQENIADDAVCSAYRCGPLIDLCRGPHIPSTSYIKAFKILKHSSCYWKNISTNIQLERVYGLTYPDKKSLRKRLAEIELCKQRDHRKIGREQGLYFSNIHSPGSIFWTFYGTIIYNKLIALIRSEYRKRGFREVITPNIYNMKLWETSGHAAKYKKDMFSFAVESQEFAVKPMNCPGHCLMFKSMQISYRDLPLRFADFGVLHRNELTGALTGLSRVRRFQQDDAHIFCAVDSIESEVQNCFRFMEKIYGIFGFKFSLVLSTRPKDYIGDKSVWDRAEQALTQCLEQCGHSWKVNEGDGAFYGPKIDVLLHDALGRSIQCATIQLDFNLPSAERFDLKYSTKEGGYAAPVIIHRAILGSVERFVSIIAEHCGGKWPFWISPRQVMVVPVAQKYNEFAMKTRDRIFAEGYEAEIDLSSNKMNKKIREAQLSQFNVILVVGQKEMETGEFTVRYRDGRKMDKMSLPSLLSMFKEWCNLETKKEEMADNSE